MSKLTEIYYAECTERELSRRYKRTILDLWECPCGTTFSTHDAPDHHCTKATPTIPVKTLPPPELIRMDTLIGTTVSIGEK